MIGLILKVFGLSLTSCSAIIGILYPEEQRTIRVFRRWTFRRRNALLTAALVGFALASGTEIYQYAEDVDSLNESAKRHAQLIKNQTNVGGELTDAAGKLTEINSSLGGLSHDMKQEHLERLKASEQMLRRLRKQAFAGEAIRSVGFRIAIPRDDTTQLAAFPEDAKLTLTLASVLQTNSKDVLAIQVDMGKSPTAGIEWLSGRAICPNALAESHGKLLPEPTSTEVVIAATFYVDSVSTCAGYAWPFPTMGHLREHRAAVSLTTKSAVEQYSAELLFNGVSVPFPVTQSTADHVQSGMLENMFDAFFIASSEQETGAG